MFQSWNGIALRWGERKALTAHINIIRHFDIIKSAGSDRKELKKKLPYDFLFYSSFFKIFFISSSSFSIAAVVISFS